MELDSARHCTQLHLDHTCVNFKKWGICQGGFGYDATTLPHSKPCLTGWITAIMLAKIGLRGLAKNFNRRRIKGLDPPAHDIVAMSVVTISIVGLVSVGGSKAPVLEHIPILDSIFCMEDLVLLP